MFCAIIKDLAQPEERRGDALHCQNLMRAAAQGAAHALTPCARACSCAHPAVALASRDLYPSQDAASIGLHPEGAATQNQDPLRARPALPPHSHTRCRPALKAHAWSTQTLLHTGYVTRSWGLQRALPAQDSHPNSALLSRVRCQGGAHRREVLKLRSKSSRIESMKGMVFRYCSGVTLVVPCTHIARSCGPHASGKGQPAASITRLEKHNSFVSSAPALEARLLFSRIIIRCPARASCVTSCSTLQQCKGASRTGCLQDMWRERPVCVEGSEDSGARLGHLAALDGAQHGGLQLRAEVGQRGVAVQARAVREAARPRKDGRHCARTQRQGQGCMRVPNQALGPHVHPAQGGAM